MADSFIQLGSLDFDDIRSNIKSYMENQSELDVNFDGSVASTILDLLAYNTMYYAFYSNMMINESFMESAQRSESLISLTKPFGYSFAHRKSATANLSVTNVSTGSATLIPYVTTFSAVGSNGLSYVFYYTGGADNEVVSPQTNQVFNEVSIEPGEFASIPVYQGSAATVQNPVNVDYTNQTIELKNKSIDPRTLRLFVEENDGTLRQYSRVGNVNNNITSSSRVYYLETSNSGYTIYFGAPRNIDGAFTGRGVGETEKVFVSYVSSSGAGGNGSTSWDSPFSALSVTTPNIVASGGISSPNINEIKFMAPREFASANRLVTVADYQKAILNLGNINLNSTDPTKNVSVYGSNQSAEQTSGTAYFSLYDQITGTILGTSSVVTDTLSNLKNDVMVGITFQYKAPTEVTVTCNLNSSDSSDYQQFSSLYPRGFNQTVDASVPSSWSSAKAEITAPLTDRKFDLKNKLESYVTTQPAGVTFTVKITDTSDVAQTGFITGSGLVNIVANSVTIGTVNTDTGYIVLDDTKMNSLQGITANYSNELTQIKIQHEILGTPVAS